MTGKKDKGDFEIHLDSEPGTPQARSHPPTGAVTGAAPEAPTATGGYVAHFEWPDGVRLTIKIAGAIAMLGGGDPGITDHYWELRKGDEILNGGSLRSLLRKGNGK